MKYVYREGGKSGFTITTARKADGPGCRELLGCRSSDRTPTLVAKGSTSTRWQVKLVKPLPTPAFYLGTNGVTVLCPEANVGDTGVVGGVPYTKRDRADLDALVAADPTDEIALTTSCTTGVTDMSQLFGSGAGSGTGAKVSDPILYYLFALTFYCVPIHARLPACRPLGRASTGITAITVTRS
jgi:hypothetical protein